MLKKISYVILIAIIIAGGVMVGLKGFNKDVPYKDNATIYVSIGKEFNVKDMRDIAKEVFGDQRVVVQVVELYKDMVSFTNKIKRHNKPIYLASWNMYSNSIYICNDTL